MATREQLIEDFADHKYATGEKFARLINSMKLVQEPVETPAASGTSLSFIDSIEQDKDGKITATKKTLDLSNAHELNPFKGWWKTGDTLPTSGFDGAYLYFKDTTQTPSVTAIYQWNGTTYAPTGTEVDESNVQTFGSGQQVNGVKINTEIEKGGVDNLVSAEILKEQLVLSSSTINITKESPYYEDTITGAYMSAPNGTIVSNQYVQTREINLFRLPAGKYVATRNLSGTTNTPLVATFATTDSFAEGGTPNSIILTQNGSVGESITFNLEQETLVAMMSDVSSTYYNYFAKLEEIKVDTIKDEVERLGDEMDALDDSVDELERRVSDMDVSGLEDRVENLEDIILTDEIINITKDSLYYEDTITGAYMTAPNGTIVSNEYVQSREINLFRLPIGKYKAIRKYSNTASSAPLVATFATTDTFVIGGTPNSIILTQNGSVGEEISFTLEQETLVAMMSDVSSTYYNYFAKLEEIKKVSSIPSQIDETINLDLDIVIPDIVYAIVGTELNIWNDTISLSIDKGLMSPMNYQVEWDCSKGTITDRCFRFKPTTDDVGNLSCTCHIYNITGALVSSKTFTIKVIAKNAIQAAKNIVYFGDSLGASAATALYDNFHDTNRYSGVVPTMLGTHGTDKKYEAVGGYGWSSYATAWIPCYRIFVSNVQSITKGTIYSDGSHRFEVYEVNISGGEGNCLLIRNGHSEDLIMPSGTLTRVSGNGDDYSVPYTGAFKTTANPLWNYTTQQLDIAQYKQAIGLQESDKIDAVSFQFGINDNYLANNLATLHTYISNLYNLFVGDNPNCKIIIGLTTSSSNDACWKSYWGYKSYLKNIYIIKKYYISLLSEFSNLRIATPNLSLDRYYGYGFETRQVSDRCTETEQYHDNNIHPNISGYKQMADAYLACYVGVLSE